MNETKSLLIIDLKLSHEYKKIPFQTPNEVLRSIYNSRILRLDTDIEHSMRYK